VTIFCRIIGTKEVEITIQDTGVGIENIYMAKEPLYTSKPELERSGMGFTIMESFMDSMDIQSTIDEGTTVVMKKQLTKTKTVCH
jgi:stage II sporulation protein AB (anti-sigma F factor)